MTNQEIANKWATYCQTGQWESALKELYADHAVSLEMVGAEGFPERVEGMAGILEKAAGWNQMVEEFHGMEIEGPIVAADHFAATMKMDITMKGQPRGTMEEVCVFKIADGKIVSEQFFYQV